jgi:hypothetical protein
MAKPECLGLSKVDPQANVGRRLLQGRNQALDLRIVDAKQSDVVRVGQIRDGVPAGDTQAAVRCLEPHDAQSVVQRDDEQQWG